MHDLNAPASAHHTDAPPRFLRPFACPRCRAVETSVVCHVCGEFKPARAVAPFADELAADERRAA